MQKELEALIKRPPTWLWFLLLVWGAILFLIYAESFLDQLGAPIGSDFYKFYLSAQRLLAGESAYWLRDAVVGGAGSLSNEAHAGLHPNLNPPFFNVLMVPLVALDYGIAFSLWSVFSVLCGAAGVYWVLKIMWGTPPPVVVNFLVQLVFFSYYPSFSNFNYGQVGFFVFFILVLALNFFNTGKKATGGILIGLAASVKLFCGFFILMLFFAKSWRAFFASALAVAVCALIGAALGGVESYLQYFAMLKTIDWYGVNWNASYTGFFYKILSSEYGFGWEAVRGVWIQAANMLTVLVAAYLSFQMASEVEKNQFNGFFSLAVPLMLIISPLGWSYYFPLLFLVFPKLLEEMRGRGWGLSVMVFFLGASITIPRIGLIGFEGLWAEGWRMYLLFFGLFLIVCSVILLNCKSPKSMVMNIPQPQI